MCEWKVKSDWCMSDYNLILLDVAWNETENMSVMNDCGIRWKKKLDVDWNEYIRMVEMNVSEINVGEFIELTLERKIEKLMEWIRDTNDVFFGRVNEGRMYRTVKWWTDELERMKQEVRKRRRMYQRARKLKKAEAKNLYTGYSEYVK